MIEEKKTKKKKIVVHIVTIYFLIWTLDLPNFPLSITPYHNSIIILQVFRAELLPEKNIKESPNYIHNFCSDGCLCHTVSSLWTSNNFWWRSFQCRVCGREQWGGLFNHKGHTFTWLRTCFEMLHGCVCITIWGVQMKRSILIPNWERSCAKKMIIVNFIADWAMPMMTTWATNTVQTLKTVYTALLF